MTTGLVGYTGFVGGNLLTRRDYDRVYNSSNIDDIRGEHFDRLVFSAARAEKWRINQDPEADAAHIGELMDVLSDVSAGQLVLVSTVDVYGSPRGVDETSPIAEEGLHAYGLHRRALEKHVADTFERSTIVRLPGLFGQGLKKNVIFDLLHDNNVDRIHADGEFQYYDLGRLADDIDRAVALDVRSLNIATEPVSTAVVAREVFGVDFQNRPDGVIPGRYDMRSVHGPQWGRSDGYLYGQEVVIADMRRFVEGERS